VRQIREAKEDGLPLSVETAQHYLYFCAEMIGNGQVAFKCAPPIREKANNEELWRALKSGIIDFVATDHSPASPAVKKIGSGDFMAAWGGVSSLQFALPVLWTAATMYECSLPQMAEWLCENPSKLAGVHQTKGRIEKGYDADLVVWSPEKKINVTAGETHHRHKISPYEGQQLQGAVKQTWLGGEKVFADGKFLHLNKGKIIRH
jgi:allantoinase